MYLRIKDFTPALVSLKMMPLLFSELTIGIRSRKNHDQGTASGLHSWLRFKLILILTRLLSAGLKNILQTNDLRAIGATLQTIFSTDDLDLNLRNQV